MRETQKLQEPKNRNPRKPNKIKEKLGTKYKTIQGNQRKSRKRRKVQQGKIIQAHQRPFKKI